MYENRTCVVCVGDEDVTALICEYHPYYAGSMVLNPNTYQDLDPPEPEVLEFILLDEQNQVTDKYDKYLSDKKNFEYIYTQVKECIENGHLDFL